MSRMRHKRAFRVALCAALTLAAFEGCTGSGDSSSLPPAGPVILMPTLDSQTLSCDDTVLLHLNLQNWKMLPPGLCGTTQQCGSARVTLLGTDGKPLATQYAATNDVSLDLSALVEPPSTLSEVHLIQVDLLNDSFEVASTAQISMVTLNPRNCEAGAGGTGASGAGAGGADGALTPGEGGAGSGGESPALSDGGTAAAAPS